MPQANFGEAGGFEKRHCVLAAGEPLLPLPRIVAGSAMSSFLHHQGRNIFRESRLIDKDGIEFLMCGAIGDAPRTERFLKVLFAICRTRINVSLLLPATHALLLRL